MCASTRLVPVGLSRRDRRQLAAWQSGLYKSFAEAGISLDHRRALPGARERRRRGSTAGHRPTPAPPRSPAPASIRPAAERHKAVCGHDLNTGVIQLNHSYARTAASTSSSLQRCLTTQLHPRSLVGVGRCSASGTRRRAATRTSWRPPRRRTIRALRVTWCAQAYREFAGPIRRIGDAVTEDHGRKLCFRD